MKLKKIDNLIHIKDDNEKSYLKLQILDDTSLRLEIIRVVYEYRNQKLATKLLSRTLEYIPKLGYKSIILKVFPVEHDDKALKYDDLLNFYSKFGFIIINDIKYDNYTIMKKIIG